MKDFLKSFIAFGLATTLEKLIAFLLVPLYVNIFSVENFGTFDIIQVTIGILTIFGIFQLDSALQRYYFDYKGVDKIKFITMIYVIVILFSFIVVTIILLVSPYLSLILFKTEIYSKLISIAILQIPLNNIIMISLLILRYEHHNIKFTILLLFKVLITLCLILFFVLVLKKEIEGIFIARLIGGLITIGLMLIVIRRKFNIHFPKHMLIKSVKYSLPLFPASIGSVLSANANRFFISTFLSITAVGIYAFSLRIASIMQMIYVAFIMAWGPLLFSKIKESNHKQYFAEILILIEIPIVLLVILISLFSKEIVQFLSPDDYNLSIKYVGGLTLYYSLFIFKEVVDIGPKVTEKTKYISYNFFITLLINFILLYFLVQRFDISGVVIAMLITNSILVLLSWIISNKIYYIPHDTLKFILNIIPAYIISLCIMYIDIELNIRIFIAFVTTIIYLILLVRTIKRRKFV